MIYVKKSDGTFEQYDDKKYSALKKDKLMFEMLGNDFGEIQKESQLSIEDKVTLEILTKTEAEKIKADQEKKKLIAEAKQYLNETDYKIIKEFEGVEICPEEIKTKRQECRDIINQG